MFQQAKWTSQSMQIMQLAGQCKLTYFPNIVSVSK
jgi:hypothetical protein